MRWIALFLVLLAGPVDAHWMHDWVKQEYKSSVSRRGLDYCLTEKRTNLIVGLVEKYCAEYNADVFEVMTILTIESGFVNRIGDRQLKPQRWCFGYGQVQVRTASDVWGRHVAGWELIKNVDLNIHTTVRYYRMLTSVCPDKQTAVRSYNAGIAGASRGKGYEYLRRFDATIRRMEKFSARRKT